VMEDQINANDLTDRLWCEWLLDGECALTAPHNLISESDLIKVPMVPDIGVVKNLEPQRVRELRLEMRSALTLALDGRTEIKGISQANEYLIGKI
jgi:predicted GNAT superfamily acetyltransferase